MNLIFIGYLKDTSKIAAIGIGESMIAMFGFSIIAGMNSALNTYISQTSGSKNWLLCIIYLKRGRLIMTLCFIPIVFVLLFSKHILVGIGQDPVVPHHAHKYIMVYLPALYLLGLTDS